MAAMVEYEYRQVDLARSVPRGVATRLLTDHAEYGHWELARVRIYPDGTRKVWMRRKVIRAMRTA